MTRLVLMAALAIIGVANAVDMKRYTFQYGNAYLYEEGIPRVIWKGGETFSRVHRLDGRSFTEARLSVMVYNYKFGSVKMEVSTNGIEWLELPLAAHQGQHRRVLPGLLFPCRELHIRFEAERKSSLRFAHYQIVGTVDGEPRKIVPPRDPVSSNVLFRTDYGELLPADSSSVRVWRAESGWRIPRRRAMPTARAASLELSMAANETEAVQLVVTPSRPLSDVRVSLKTPLKGEDGTMLPGAVDILRVGYVPIRIPTDGVGVRADYPDPLPPQDAEPFPVAKGENQPFWVRIRIPKGIKGGRYSGELEVSFIESGSAVKKGRFTVSLEVDVFGFALPNEMTCRSLFGLNVNNIRRYHRISDNSEFQSILERYIAAFSEYKISPYNPAPHVKWSVKWNNDEPIFDWTFWDEAMERALNKYHFNTFRINVDGLGDGNSISHKCRSIGGVREGDPRYEVRMKAYLGGIERHLKEKGWLRKAVVYWFDEPSEKDYPYVMSGFDILRRYAPGLARSITEEPIEGLLGGPNLWCSHIRKLNDNPAVLKEAREKGDAIWWYLCWLPKAPYTTLFIDHPAVELRTWLWQTWQQDVSGILIWEVAHWQSSFLYGKTGALQNPYEDPMNRHSYGKCFGNGDGMLFYPPKNPKAYPVGSIRLEMLRDGI
ncbi:MAG: DUF4091 domain-containing protein [Kiritimatiellae bacterium]|nr:DUF4091 domain-containing protein [Kiritimatiellia bacterium]